MANKGTLTKYLAIAGTVLLILPVAAPVIFAFVALFTRGQFLFDYLLPAELLPVVLAGSGLLIWAAIRARAYRRLIIWSFAAGIVVLFAGQGLAVATGLATGEAEAEGIWWVLTLASLIVFDLAVVAVAAGGILLLRNIFQQPNSIGVQPLQ